MQYEYDYYLIEMSWKDGASFPAKETDLLYEVEIGVEDFVYIKEEALYKMPVDQLQPKENEIFKISSELKVDILEAMN